MNFLINLNYFSFVRKSCLEIIEIKIDKLIWFKKKTRISLLKKIKADYQNNRKILIVNKIFLFMLIFFLEFRLINIPLCCSGQETKEKKRTQEPY